MHEPPLPSDVTMSSYRPQQQYKLALFRALPVARRGDNGTDRDVVNGEQIRIGKEAFCRDDERTGPTVT